jgi:predicted DNA-binding protein with PD1-like motif
VVFGTGDEPVDGLKRFAQEQQITGAQITGIGALASVTVGYFEWERKDYKRITFDEQVEVLTLAGNIGLEGDQPRLHAHIVLGRSDGAACGGHLMAARVRPTLELVVLETPRQLQRLIDPETGLALIDLSA